MQAKAGEYKKRKLSPPPAQSYAGPGAVPCDFCTGRKLKAVKSCLTCLASYCETHVKPHSEGAAFKWHKLINAIGNLEQKLCTEHQKAVEVFCRTDQKCICVLCTVKEHKSHDTVSAETERIIQQEQLGETHTEIQQKIHERLHKLEELKGDMESLKSNAQKEIKKSENISIELIQSIGKIQTEVTGLNQAKARMKKLEQETAELRRRNAELKQLSETEDHIHFLQNIQSLCAPPEDEDLPIFTVNTDISFVAVRKAVSELKGHIEDCKQKLIKITTTDSCQLTLDPNTAHTELCLSEVDLKASLMSVSSQEDADDYPPIERAAGCYIYVICEKDTHFYKVGRTINPSQRLRDLNIGNHRELIYKRIRHVSETYWEKHLQNMMKKYHVNKGGGTEWFKIPKQHKQCIYEMFETLPSLTEYSIGEF